ncbi:peptide ABC transporter ATP-binding protein [Brachybacterium vulturis]|uniref:Peptide ABC transporter ATP-binding protein n=1 Tax=Brachybacterium vulturis TaxID=2017484 RepID=A0A291GMW3_9MICO|nr:ABC transporter ATP-binding protein [Brachybacterium vulturis]ATG51487.1 peptide ABC transporter ATP-binding protein [Brachybacterium vulturis]
MSIASPRSRSTPTTPEGAGHPVFEAHDLSVHFRVDSPEGKVTVRALDGIDFTLREGEIAALVGESGSGKTTLARVFSLIHAPTGGDVRVGGVPLKKAAKDERRYYRDVQLIFQDPFASLNALKKIRHIVERPVRIHRLAAGRRAIAEKVTELLERVNLTPASRYIDRYPTDLSGGQRQRVAIAKSLAVNPKVLLADEPTSMLDASIRLEVLNLLSDLRESEGLAVLYITHDIASARYVSDRIHVMYGGRIIESGPTEQIVSDPVHPYTRLLIDSAPDPAHFKGSGHSAALRSSTAAPVDNSIEVVGCRFANRCPLVRPECTSAPIPRSFGPDGRDVLCVLADERPDFTCPTPTPAADAAR